MAGDDISTPKARKFSPYRSTQSNELKEKILRNWNHVLFCGIYCKNIYFGDCRCYDFDRQSAAIIGRFLDRWRRDYLRYPSATLCAPTDWLTEQKLYWKLSMTAYLLFSSFRSDKYCEWIVNQYVIFCENDCMMLGNESTRNKINKIKPYYIVVLILHSCLLSMWYVLFITKWDIRKRENFFKFYTVTILYNGTQFVDFVSSWKCLT